MTKDRKYKRALDRKFKQGRAYASAVAKPKHSSATYTRAGSLKSTQDTDPKLIAARGQITFRANRIKPSMPKMTWE